MSDPVYDKIVVGGGIAGLSAAYEILRAAHDAGKNIKVAVLTDKLHVPCTAGTNIVFGVDGFEEGDLPPNAPKINNLVRKGLQRILDTVRHEGINCRTDMHYQLIAPTKTENQEILDFLAERFGYRKSEFHEVKNAGTRLKFPGLDHAMATHVIGQLNLPEYIKGLVKAIQTMGGEVLDGHTYVSHDKVKDYTEIRTAEGQSFKTSSPPLLAGGPFLMSQVQGMPSHVFPMYTIAMHVPLTEADARKMSDRPVAFFNPTMDFLWGSLDSKHVLTLGQGDSLNKEDRPHMETKVRETFAHLFPDLAEKYKDKITFSFNAMAYTEDKNPVVGRVRGHGTFPDFDVITGNCGRGVVQAVAQSQAYAKSLVYGQEDDLKLWESLAISRHQPRFESPLRPGGTTEVTEAKRPTI